MELFVARQPIFDGRKEDAIIALTFDEYLKTGEEDWPLLLPMTPEYVGYADVGLDDGRVLVESNAILCWLAEGTPYLPADPWQRAQAMSWMFFEQYSHEPYIAVARFIAKYLGLPEERKAEYEAKQSGGHKALAVMEVQLSTSPYLTGDSLSTADISLYGYTHVANEGGFDISEYPSISAWINRIQKEPNYIGML